MDGGWNLRNIEVFLLSLTLLFLALVGARAHAETRLEVVGQLQAWRAQTSAQKTLSPREKDLRLDFVDRLIFQTERKYQEGPLTEFFLKALGDMSETDQMASNQTFASMTEFLENAQEALGTLIEKNERPLLFLQRFTEFSSISKPKSVEEFAETRSYYDGKKLQSAHPMELDEAAEYVEKRESKASLQELREYLSNGSLNFESSF